jgi:hypothetical protein
MPLSPELALVDPDLSARARVMLADPPDTLEALRRRPLVPHSDKPVVVAPTRLRGARRPSSLMIGVAIAVIATVLLADVRVEFGRNGAAAEPPSNVGSSPQMTTAVTQPPKAPRAASPSRAAKAEPLIRRLAWAPVAGASGYRVEIFRGARRVYVANTTEAFATVRTLRPGEYRWYVWSLRDGRRSTGAIVQASLDVPSS